MNDRFEKMRKLQEDFINETALAMIKFLNGKFSRFHYENGILTYNINAGPERTILQYT